MSKTKVLQCLSLFVIFLSACSPAHFDPKPLPTNAAPQPVPSLADAWSVKLTQSGGFAGVMLTVEVASDGTIKTEDARSGKSLTQTLSSTQLNQLKDLILATKISPNAAPYPGCADCFIFTLEINSNGTVSRVQVDDITAKDSGALNLINTLRQLRNTMLGVNY